MEARRADHAVEWGVASMTLPGQKECGDLHLVKEFSGGVLVGVVDGLGHGVEAAVASRKAIETMEGCAQRSVISILQTVHKALKATRGAVLSLASFNAKENTMSWLGVGNVEGVLLRADEKAKPNHEVVLLRGGVVGYQIPEPYASTVQVRNGDTLIFTTDGIRADFTEFRSLQGDDPQKVADTICAEWAKGNDDALALVARYHGMNHG